MLGRAAAPVIGARAQPASTRGWSRGSTRAPMTRAPRAAYRWRRATSRRAGSCRSSPWCCRSSSWRPRSHGARRPRCTGRGLLVLVALVGYVALLGFGVVWRTRHIDPMPSWALLGVIGACALVLALVQPDGAGVLALYITLGIAASRSSRAARSPCSPPASS